MMNTHRVTIAKHGKKLLFSCAIIAVIACSTAFLPGSHALAATSSHTSETKALNYCPGYGAYCFSDIIGPAWNYNPGCGTGWSNGFDTNFASFKYSYTTGSRACTSAVWNDSGHTLGMICDLNVYIPTLFATANITYGIVDAYGTERMTINQNNVSGWQSLGYGYDDISYVYISSNNGQNGTAMAAGQMQFLCYG